MSQFERLVGWRIIKSRKRMALSIVTTISIVGIILGVAAMTVVLSVCGGFQTTFKEKILQFRPQIIVRKFGSNFYEYREIMERIRECPHVVGVSPATYHEMMAVHKGQRSGIWVKGIHQETIGEITDLDQFIKHGSSRGLTPRDGELPGILLGEALFKTLKVNIGDTVNIISPLRGLDNAMLAPLGMAPTSGEFKVIGQFYSGWYEADSRLGIIDFNVAQQFMNRGDVARWIEVKVNNILDIKVIADEVRQYIHPYSLTDFIENGLDTAARLREFALTTGSDHGITNPPGLVPFFEDIPRFMGMLITQDWSFGYKEKYQVLDFDEMHHNIFSALKMQKIFFTLFFFIIIVVASFNVVGSQMMIVNDKIKEIAILKSMGATSWGIRKIFLFQGLVIGTIGTTLGLILGYLCAVIIRTYRYPLDPKVYLISYLPIEIQPLEFINVALAALICVFGASLYAANQAAKKAPADGLRMG